MMRWLYLCRVSTWQESDCLKTKKRVLTITPLYQHLGFRFPVSRTLRNKCCFLSHLVYGILLWQPKLAVTAVQASFPKAKLPKDWDIFGLEVWAGSEVAGSPMDSSLRTSAVREFHFLSVEGKSSEAFFKGKRSSFFSSMTLTHKLPSSSPPCERTWVIM
jgi:hypothetical protein